MDIGADLRGPIGDTVRTYSFEIYYPPENPTDTVILSGYPIFEQRYLCMDYDNELHFGTVSREIRFSPPDTLPCDYPDGKILASETWQYAHADGNGETNPVTAIYPRYGYKTFPQCPGCCGVVPYSLDIKWRGEGLLSDEQEELSEPVVFEHTYQEIEEIIANIIVLRDSSEFTTYWNERRKQSFDSRNDASFSFSISAFPSPFNEQVTITVTIPVNDFLTIDIYNLSGKLVKRLFSGNVSVGRSNFKWDCVDSNGNKVPGGVYFVKAVYQSKSIRTKLLLAK